MLVLATMMLTGCVAPAALEAEQARALGSGVVVLQGTRVALPPVEGEVQRPTVFPPVGDSIRPPGAEDRQSFDLPEGVVFLRANLSSEPAGSVVVDFFDANGDYVEDIWWGEEPGVELRVLGLHGTWTTVAVMEQAMPAKYRLDLEVVS